MTNLHPTDRYALLSVIVGVGSYAAALVQFLIAVLSGQGRSMAIWQIVLIFALIALGVAGQVASQLLRVYGAPSFAQKDITIPNVPTTTTGETKS